jgi:tight adherence protein B
MKALLEPGPHWLKWSGIGVLALALVVLVSGVISDPQSLPHRYWLLYISSLERKLRIMFMPTKGRHIAVGQLLAAALAIGFGLYRSTPYAFLLLPIIAILPAYYIEQVRKARLRAIEAKMDSFILTLANALKSTPSIGNALAYTQQLVAPPLDEELALALKEMRVGNTLDQALLNMSGRLQSLQLDATLSGILIGRQIGGDLTKILETTASTLREMARLQGVVRSKTAEGKAQLGILAVFPVIILFLFDTVSPGYFDPLSQSVVGYVIVIAAATLWVASLIMARKVLAVDV